jgi:hypothetical protein
MPKTLTIAQIRTRTLFRHFFRRFFDNDSLPVPGDPETSVFRVASFCAVPAVMFTVWLMPQYHTATGMVTDFFGTPKPWVVEGHRYFFVLFSFVIMGIIATCEWEMLFPDRADFLILLSLPLKARELLYTKSRALLTLFALFLAATNFFSVILYPAVSTGRQANYLHTVWAHGAAVLLAGIFAAFTMLAIEGLVLCLLPPGWFRAISTAIQTISITLLLLLFLLYPLIAGQLQSLMSGQASFANFIPPLWFLGLYETLLHGNLAPAAAWPLTSIGLYATALVVSLSVLTYPLAWARQKKRALEGAAQARTKNGSNLTAVLHKIVLKRPQQRAIFHFIGQTISRSPRYQIFLALYAGAGISLALCSVIRLQQSPSHALIPALSKPSLHAALPLLLFWMLAGLRSSFGFPVDLLSRWVFPLNLRLAGPTTSIDPDSSHYSSLASYAFPGRAAKAAKTWTQLCSWALIAILLVLLFVLGWTPRELFVQAICAFALSILLADLFFLGRTQIPFTRLRVPGLALAFILYVIFFPTVIGMTVQFELHAESRLPLLLWIAVAIPVLHLLLRKTDRLAQQGIIGGFPEDEIDPGPQTLNLFQ